MKKNKRSNTNNNNNNSNNGVIIRSIMNFLRSYRSIIIAVITTAIITINITMIFNFHKCDNYYNVNYNNSDTDGSSFSKSVAASFFSSSDQKQKKLSKTKTTTKTKTSSLPPPPPPPDFNYDTIPSIVWQPWNINNNPKISQEDHNNTPFPCYPPDDDDLPFLQRTKPAHEGILFQRPTKVGSTTMTNIVLRLVHNRGQKEYEKEKEIQKQNKLLMTTTNTNKTITMYHPDEQIWTNIKKNKKLKNHGPRCKYRANHGSAIHYEYPKRNLQKSFLFSLQRYPISRAVSQFFHFHVSADQNEPTDANFQAYLQRNQSNNPMIRDLSFNATLPKQLNLYYKQYKNDIKNEHEHEYEHEHNNNNEEKKKKNTGTGTGTGTATTTKTRIEMDYNQIVTDILKSYNFIAIMERMNESLVALKLLLNLTLEEILYVKPSRTSGSFSNGPRTDKDWRPCIYLIPSFLTSSMKTYFYGNTNTNTNTNSKTTRTSSNKNDNVINGNEHWIEFIKGDLLLYQAVNKSLDRTINEIFGRELFDTHLKEFELAQKYANTICGQDDDLVVPMCDSKGHDIVNDPNRSTTCYIWSEGCDHKCLNERIPHPIPKEILISN